MNFLPFSKQTFEEWWQSINQNPNSYFDGRSIEGDSKFDGDRDYKIFGSSEPYRYWYGAITNILPSLKKNSIYIEVKWQGQSIRTIIFPNELGRIIPSPVPWVVRFPHVFFLDNIPPWPRKGQGMKGRPQDWALNLLVYELSQAGMKDKQIASFLRTECPEMLFGEIKNYQGKSDKDPFLVRINDIKKRVKNIVSKAYPFPEST